MMTDVAPSEQAEDPDPSAFPSSSRDQRRPVSNIVEPPQCSMAIGQSETRMNNAGERGLFAKVGIRRGQVVVAFGGRAIPQAELDSLPSSRRRFALQIEEGIYLYSDHDGAGDWVNHSCAPNVGLRGQIILVAMRDIDRDEEICFDYAMTDVSDYDSFPCSCGHIHCRRKVSGADWQIPELQKRYAGFFAPHVERLIAGH